MCFSQKESKHIVLSGINVAVHPYCKQTSTCSPSCMNSFKSSVSGCEHSRELPQRLRAGVPRLVSTLVFFLCGCVPAHVVVISKRNIHPYRRVLPLLNTPPSLRPNRESLVVQNMPHMDGLLLCAKSVEGRSGQCQDLKTDTMRKR